MTARRIRPSTLMYTLRLTFAGVLAASVVAGGPATAFGDESVKKLPPVETDEPPQQPPPVPKRKVVGEPLAAGMIRLMQNEIVAGLKGRRIQDKFSRFRSYAGSKLNASAGRARSELTGNCRLRWYDHLLRNPLKAPAEAEAFTRQLHLAASSDHEALAATLAIAGAKLDLGSHPPRAFLVVNSPQQALEVIKQSLTDGTNLPLAVAALTAATAGAGSLATAWRPSPISPRASPVFSLFMIRFPRWCLLKDPNTPLPTIQCSSEWSVVT